MSTLSLGLGGDPGLSLLMGLQEVQKRRSGRARPRVTWSTVGEVEIRALAVLHQNFKFVHEIVALLDACGRKIWIGSSCERTSLEETV